MGCAYHILHTFISGPVLLASTAFLLPLHPEKTSGAKWLLPSSIATSAVVATRIHQSGKFRGTNCARARRPKRGKRLTDGHEFLAGELQGAGMLRRRICSSPSSHLWMFAWVACLQLTEMLSRDDFVVVRNHVTVCKLLKASYVLPNTIKISCTALHCYNRIKSSWRLYLEAALWSSSRRLPG